MPVVHMGLPQHHVDCSICKLIIYNIWYFGKYFLRQKYILGVDFRIFVAIVTNVPERDPAYYNSSPEKNLLQKSQKGEICQSGRAVL